MSLYVQFTKAVWDTTYSFIILFFVLGVILNA